MLIPYPVLKKRYKIESKGVIHIGANDAKEELFWYYGNGIERTVWVEAIPAMYERLKKTIEMSGFNEAIPLNACVSDADFKKVKFNISSNNGESSSMLEFGTHATTYPDIKFVDQISLRTMRMDTLLRTNLIDARNYDFLNIDVQGAELLVLKGMGDMLRIMKHVYIEINRAEVYKGCAQVDEITAYLEQFGFRLKETKWATAGDWGDAYYQKDTDMSVFHRPRNLKYGKGIINVPDRFMTQHPFPYPPDNTHVFERWFYDNFDGEKDSMDRQYLPIQWTGYLVSHSFGNDPNAIRDLQSYVDNLDRNKKYYTIHQFDLGCMVDFKDLDILVFGMAGGRIDYPLPLLCQPHKYIIHQPTTLLANFIGKRTHPIRDKMISVLTNHEGIYISEMKHDLSAYCSIIASSVFTLCPRGFSGTSFRVLEALQYGSIPIIITDELIEPHHVPVNEYAIVIGEDQLTDDLPALLRTIMNSEHIKEKINKLKYYFDHYFTYASNKKLILEKVKATA